MASDALLVFCESSSCFLFTRTGKILVKQTLSSITDCVIEASKNVPLASIKAAFIPSGDLNEVQNYVFVLQKFGIKRIVYSEPSCSIAVFALLGIENDYQPTDYTAVILIHRSHIDCTILTETAIIMKKQGSCLNVVHFINTLDLYKLKKWWPQLKSIIYVYPLNTRPLKECEKTVFSLYWPNCQIYFTDLYKGIDQLDSFIWNQYNNNALIKNYYTSLQFEFNNIQVPVSIFTFKQVVHLDIKNAPTLEISIACADPVFEKLKVFKFKSEANRKVAITVINDETLIPTFAIKTMESFSPVSQKVFFSVVAKIILQNNVPFTVKTPYFIAEWCNSCIRLEIISFPSGDLPYSRKRRFHIGSADRLNLRVGLKIIEEFPFLTPKDRVVTVECGLNEYMRPKAQIIKEETVPPMIFEFTSDNRMLIYGPADYKGPTEYPAYASFKDGNLVAGAAALKTYKEHPRSVVFDIPRLLLPDLSFKTANPDWQFSFSRGAKGEIIFDLEDAKTTPCICFALILKSVLINVRENYDTPIDRIGIKMPDDYDISDEWETKISEHIGVSILVFN